MERQLSKSEYVNYLSKFIYIPYIFGNKYDHKPDSSQSSKAIIIYKSSK